MGNLPTNGNLHIEAKEIPNIGAHLCFWPFTLHFQMLGSIFRKLGKQGLKLKLRFWIFQICKNFILVTKGSKGGPKHFE